MTLRPVDRTHVQAGAGSVRLSSMRALQRAIGRAGSVELGAYILRRDNPLVDALEAAAARGARVSVRLGTPYRDPTGKMAQASDALVAALRAHGVDAVRTPGFNHAKTAIVDGRVYLDDRNWSRHGRDTIVEDSRAADVAAVRRGFEGKAAAATGSFAAMKRDALRLERDVIAASRGGLDVETETIGPCALSTVLRSAAAREPVRLIVSSDELKTNPRERPTLERLAHAGAQIRIGAASSGVGNEKLCVSGTHAWVGSANATWEGPGAGAVDWGLRTDARGIAAALHARFEENWDRSRPFLAA